MQNDKVEHSIDIYKFVTSRCYNAELQTYYVKHAKKTGDLQFHDKNKFFFTLSILNLYFRVPFTRDGMCIVFWTN